MNRDEGFKDWLNSQKDEDELSYQASWNYAWNIQQKRIDELTRKLGYRQGIAHGYELPDELGKAKERIQVLEDLLKETLDCLSEMRFPVFYRRIKEALSAQQDKQGGV